MNIKATSSLNDKLSPMLLADFYKIAHREQYPEKTEVVYSNWTPRSSRIDEIQEVVVFGIQGFIKSYLMDFFENNFFSRPKEEIIKGYVRMLRNTLLIENPDTQHISDLHDLGYLPLEIKALAEGTVAPVRIPVMTIKNTDPRFYWLTNFIETIASCELWQAATSATIARRYKTILSKYAEETGDPGFVQFQGHDFSMRGMAGLQSAMLSGAGHLLSFVGSDTIPAITYLETYYRANIEGELVGTSIPATEHSVMCANGMDETASFRRLLTEVYPKGFVSVVSDTWDLWHVLGTVLPGLKEVIINRDGKLVIRPDSGNPADIICGDEKADGLARKGTVEVLWDTFGGTVNDKGYKVLDPHIGCIYGEAITMQVCESICQRLKAKGFASTNVVYGIGSYTYQYKTRDTFGFSYKSTACVIDGQEKAIFKDPKTDDGLKKSQRGRVRVFSQDGKIQLTDGHSLADTFTDDLLKTVYLNGELLVDQSLADIRGRMN